MWCECATPETFSQIFFKKVGPIPQKGTGPQGTDRYISDICFLKYPFLNSAQE